MAEMKPATMAAPLVGPLSLSLKSHLVVGSVTSTIKQEALCGEQQPPWEQRERDRGDREEENRRCGRGFADMDH